MGVMIWDFWYLLLVSNQTGGKKSVLSCYSRKKHKFLIPGNITFFSMFIFFQVKIVVYLKQ